MFKSTKAVLTLLAVTVVLFGHAQNASAISCYSGSGYSGSGPFPSVNCATGFTSCYTNSASYMTTYFYSGCGSCNASSTQGCVVCNTDNCNSLTPSSISCYANSGMSSGSFIDAYRGRGSPLACYTGISSCYLYTDSGYVYSGCGNCNTGTYASCVTCNTNFCNTFLPSSISCYHRNGQLYFTSPYTYLSGNNGVVYPCNAGVTSCYSYLSSTNVQSQGFYSSFAGCGVCDATGVRFGCKTCNTSNCNYFTADSSADTATVSTSRKSSWWLRGSRTEVVAAGTIALVTKLRFNSI